MKNYRAVVFDWNGTVLDDLEFCLSLLNELLSECDLPEVSIERYREIFRFPIIDYYRLAGFNFDAVSYEELADRYIPRYEGRYKTACALHDGALELARKCREAGVKTAILSVTKQEYLLEQVKHFGASDYFDEVMGLDDHYGGGKTALGRVLLKKLGIDPTEVLFIGDTTHDGEVASAIGCDFMLFSGGHQSETVLRSVTDKVFHSYAELIDKI